MRNILKQKEHMQKIWRENKLIDILRKVTTSNATPHQVALGAAIGLFVSIIPTFFVGMLIALYVAWDRKLNMVSTFLATMLVNPLNAPFVYVANYKIGSFILQNNTAFKFPETIGEFTVFATRVYTGGIVFAAIASAILYGLVYWAVQSYRKKKNKTI